MIWNFKKNILIYQDDLILLLCSPKDEVLTAEKYPNTKIINGRLIGKKIKKIVINDYNDLITNFSLCLNKNKKTLRSKFQIKADNINTWWFNLLSNRDSEVITSYRSFFHIKIIEFILKSYQIDKLKFIGVKKNIYSYFKIYYKHLFKNKKEITCANIFFYFKTILRQFLSRTKYLFSVILTYFIIKFFYRKPRLNKKKKKLGLVNFIDWGFEISKKYKITLDKYFKELSYKLKIKNVNHNYLLKLDINTVPNLKYDKIKLIKSVSKNPKYLLIDSYISLSDIFKFYFYYWIDLFKLIKSLNTIKKSKNKYFVLLKEDFFYHGLSTEVMKNSIISNAFKNLFNDNSQYKICLTFLENFLFTRSLALGLNNSNTNTKLHAMQHCTYSIGNTQAYMNSSHEYKKSNIDNLMQPHFQKIFVMGKENKKLFQSFGYNSNEVLLFGSTRYHHVQFNNINTKNKNNKIFKILIPLAFNDELHLHLIQAVYYATKKIKNIEIVIRNHPYRQIEYSDDWIKRNKSLFTFSKSSLEEDFSNCHLVISSYSTVSEESLLYGLPFIHYRGLNYEWNPLAFEEKINSVSTVTELTDLIKKMKLNYHQFLPSKKLKDELYKKYFYPSQNSFNNISNYYNEIL